MSIASIALPRILRIGGGASKQLPEVLASLGLSRPLIVTDGWLVSSGRVVELVDGLAAGGVASGGCRFCSMLAGRGEVYRADTARFASHPNCHCTAAPVMKMLPSRA